MQLNVTIDSSIKFNPKDIPKNVLNEILGRLKIPNPQRKLADKEMLWNAKDIPEFVELWKFNSYNELVLPRGFIFEFEKLLKDNQIEVCWIDKRNKCAEYLHDVDLISLRIYQSTAIDELAEYGSGIYKASTGSGKTRCMLELARSLHQRTLIICEKLDIAEQWEKTAREFGFKVGMVNEESWSVGFELTICLRQTLLSRIDKLTDYKWFDKWGMVILDESHHSVAPSMFELLGRFPAYYRFGCSATPDSDEDLFPIVRAIIGPVVTESSPEEIGDHLVIPSVKVVKTEFDYPYRPTERLGKKVIRNNYNDMMNAVEKDYERNLSVIVSAHKEARQNHHCLIISKRKRHLKILIETLNHWYDADTEPISIRLFTGDNSDDLFLIRAEIESSKNGTILFSTLAEEGTDIPRLDRLFLAYPGRKLRGFEQAIGRIMRPYPGKKDAIVYDFRDYKVSLLNSQFRDRNQRIYHKKNYKVENVNG